ncbi:hypothetical protein B0T24DRAFT_531834 [Lasiosphaeria ovina]|uniref:Transcription initiation factor TFIID subunit 4 n=1 Tax=Lasiosphaeria ovina TaxID=92902 RepID=A0AAE0K7I9_9PEZI|nr:hypothetical protein B0T24DRAFT_531834 [Lasiosphaeria ovina]
MPQIPQMSPQLPQMSPQMSQMPQMSPQIQMGQLPQISPQMGQLPQMAPRPSYSPPQNSPSPAPTPQPGFAMPPNKRPRNSPGPLAQPPSPYTASPYARPSPAPVPAAAPSPALASPAYSNIPAPIQPQPHQQIYLPPSYANGNGNANGNANGNGNGNGNSAPSPVATPTLTLPESRPVYTPTSAPPAPLPIQQQHSTAAMAPIHQQLNLPSPTPGTMGPPSKPAERPTREYEYDVSDSLAGTGIDLRAEEQALADYYAGSFAQEAKTGAPSNAPGGKGSFYGAGWANQPAQATDASQEEFAAEAAKKAWEDAANRLATQRIVEIKNPFLEVSITHYRADKIAKEHGIGLNVDFKTQNQMGKMRLPQDFPQPKVTVSTKVGLDGAMVMTSGSWIPHDSYLADQLALLSIATRHRIREMLEEANSVAIVRQTTSHGEVPEEWADVSQPLKTGLESLPDDSAGGVAPQTNPLKRSFDAANADNPPPTSDKALPKNLKEAVNAAAKLDRDIEEARMKKRQKRLNPEAAPGGSRSGSTVPGTPGSTAPETEKAPSKKELKKGAAAARMSEASSTASANQTLSTLMGGFGGKKKIKQYSWMKAGNSGPTTPRSSAQDATSAATTPGLKVPESTALTIDGRTRLGVWREDKQKGKNIQLRDWVTVLEQDGMDTRAIQSAYLKLDDSTPK